MSLTTPSRISRTAATSNESNRVGGAVVVGLAYTMNGHVRDAFSGMSGIIRRIDDRGDGRHYLVEIGSEEVWLFDSRVLGPRA